MADIRLEARPVLGDADIRIGGNRIRERDDLALVSAAVPQGGEAAFIAALKSQWGLEMPDARLSRAARDIRAIRTAPDQILLMMPKAGPVAEPMVQAAFDGAAYTTEQTGAWVILEVSGAETGAALERLCPLDLHPSSFPADASARTVMEHMGALIVRLEEHRFLLMSASSSAASFLHAVETSYAYVTA